MQTLTYSVRSQGIVDVKMAALRFNRSFDRIKNFGELVYDRTGVKLSVAGKPLMNYKTQDALLDALSSRGTNPLRVEAGLKLFAGALEQYELIYSDLFKRAGVVLVGDPEIDVPLIDGTEKKITDEWVKNIVVSNVFNCAMRLNDSLALEILLKDVPLHNWKTALRGGNSMDWDLQSAHETFLTLYFLEEAMNSDAIRTMMEESVPLHEIRNAVLRYASTQGIPVKIDA
jgi:hypothetical protein